MEVADLWHRVLNDPCLQDLPYRIETNEFGQLVLSPRNLRHSFLKARLVSMLARCLPQNGEPVVELAIRTAQGIKVPDVAWMSTARWEQVSEDAEASPVTPELVIEVLSPGNTSAEMNMKRALYFEGGAREVWFCDTDGHVRFFDAEGERPASSRAPSFPTAI